MTSRILQPASQFHLSSIDIQFARLMQNYSESDDQELFLACALVSKSTRDGNICLDLARPYAVWDEKETILETHDISRWRQTLRRFPVVGCPGDFTPLILDKAGRLYLYRYWEYEKKLADLILERVQKKPAGRKSIKLDQFQSIVTPDWQKVAAYAALTRSFCAISGSPGTGKTTTAAKILAAYLDQTDRADIVLAAPTGKAAARLKEAILSEKQLFQRHIDRIPQETYTLHRLLGGIPNPPFFKHNALNKITADLVIIDEASMADLPMMSRLLQALPSNASLILMGDRDQLASVNPGAIFSDICSAGDIDAFSDEFCRGYYDAAGDKIPSSAVCSPMSDCLIQLKTNYRFSSSSGIYEVSQAVNSGNAGNGVDKMASGQYDDIEWKDLPDSARLQEALRDRILEGFSPYLNGSDPEDIFERFRRFRILCAHRTGNFGVESMNTAAEKILKEHRLIQPQRPYYWGRPLLITQNNYHLKLFNGDLGIVLNDADGTLKVFFMTPDGTIRKFHPARLPDHETAYAMTVHKSQGSEFDEVMLILPDRESPILTRELIYTGITRARKKAVICGNKDILFKAILEKIQRTSGLRDALSDAMKSSPM